MPIPEQFRKISPKKQAAELLLEDLRSLSSLRIVDRSAARGWVLTPARERSIKKWYESMLRKFEGRLDKVKGGTK